MIYNFTLTDNLQSYLAYVLGGRKGGNTSTGKNEGDTSDGNSDGNSGSEGYTSDEDAPVLAVYLYVDDVKLD